LKKGHKTVLVVAVRTIFTRSPVIRERLCDASRLYAASFNITMPQVQTFIAASDLPMRTIKFCSDVFGVMTKLSVINKIH